MISYKLISETGEEKEINQQDLHYLTTDYRKKYYLKIEANKAIFVDSFIYKGVISWPFVNAHEIDFGFRGIKDSCFKDCTFDKIIIITTPEISNTEFNNCYFDGSSFLDVDIISNCNFDYCNFTKTQISQSMFSGNKLQFCYFNSSSMFSSVPEKKLTDNSIKETPNSFNKCFFYDSLFCIPKDTKPTIQYCAYLNCIHLPGITDISYDKPPIEKFSVMDDTAELIKNGYIHFGMTCPHSDESVIKDSKLFYSLYEKLALNVTVSNPPRAVCSGVTVNNATFVEFRDVSSDVTLDSHPVLSERYIDANCC